MGDFLSNLSNIPQYAADWWNGKRSINPVSWAWNSLPGNVKDTYTSGLRAAVDMSTPASVRDYTTSAQDTARSAMQGDGWGTATSGLGMVNAALGAIPIAGMGVRAAQQGARLGGKALGMGVQEAAPGFIRAYHGSPHSFDKFDLSKIGTGEGVQAYGHGLYFAENEGVARGYKTQLSGDPTISGRAINWSNPAEHAAAMVYSEGNRDAAIRALSKEVEYLRGTKGFDEASHDGARALRYLTEGRDLPSLSNPGSMYEVAIHADPAKFLDWDKAIAAQNPEVRSTLANTYGNSRAMMADNVWQGKDGRWFTAQGETLVGRPDGWPDQSTAQAALRVMQEEGLPNLTAGEWMRKLGSPATQSEKLRDAGIPGIKYLDGGSRAAGDGSRNFVVFDDSIIEILRKYGLLPAAGAAGFYGATAGDPQPQGAY